MGASQLYSWDEVGRLVRARRWDQASVPADPNTTPVAVDLQYHYAAGDSRVLKTARSGNQEVHTAYIFPSLELRRAEFDTDAPGDYTLDSSTEVAYLFANGVRLARLVHQPLDSAGDGVLLRVFFELGDHLGSTSVALDKDTGELVERSTYQAYGGAESSYRPSKWGEFREDYRFTGKEEDVEVGLTYFGKRFYNAALQRWVSADPLEVHQPGQADANLYAYVSGAALKNIDPLGLAETAANATDESPNMSTCATSECTGSAEDVTTSEPGSASPDAPDRASAEPASEEGRDGTPQGSQDDDDAYLPSSEEYGNAWTNFKDVVKNTPRYFDRDYWSRPLSTEEQAEVDKVQDGAGEGVPKAVREAVEDFWCGVTGCPKDTTNQDRGNDNVWKSKGKQTKEDTGSASTKGGGKNSAHANADKRAAAADRYAALKAELEKLKSTPNKTPKMKEEIDRMRKAVDKAKKDMDFTGENHSQRAKGQR